MVAWIMMMMVMLMVACVLPSLRIWVSVERSCPLMSLVLSTCPRIPPLTEKWCIPLSWERLWSLVASTTRRIRSVVVWSIKVNRQQCCSHSCSSISILFLFLIVVVIASSCTQQDHAQIVLDGSQVAMQHCKFTNPDGEAFVVPLTDDERFETTVNGKKITKRTKLTQVWSHMLFSLWFLIPLLSPYLEARSTRLFILF